MSGKIKVNGILVPIKLTPKDLEFQTSQKYYRRESGRKNNIFRTNPNKVFAEVCKVYGITFKIRKYKMNPTTVKVELEMPAMDASIYLQMMKKTKVKVN